MNELIEQRSEPLLIRECLPFVQTFVERVIGRHFRAIEKILIGHREERRYPRLQALRLRVWLLDRIQDVEDIVGLTGLKQPVLLVESKGNPLLPKIAADFDRLGATASEYEDILRLDASRLFVVADQKR